MKKLLLFLLFFLLLNIISITNAFAQTWISFNGNSTPEKPICEVIETSDYHIVIDIKLLGFYKQDVVENGNKYQKISFPGYQTTHEIGLPAMPIISELIQVPKGSNLNITISNENITYLDGYRIYPFQTPLLEDEVPTSFDIDNTFYSTNAYYPENSATLSAIRLFRNVANTNLVLTPIKNNPVDEKLEIIKSFQVRIDFDQKLINETTKFSDQFDKLHKLTILNYITPTSINPTKSTDYNLLIISADQYANNLDQYIGWKKRKGYRTKLVNLSETGNTASSIKSYIETEYNNHNIEYVLLVGDFCDIPHVTMSEWPDDECNNSSVWTGYGIPFSDYGYGIIENDYQPEVLVGRFSIQNLNELNNLINKTLNYEHSPIVNNWVKKCLLIAHKEDAGTSTSFQANKEYIRNDFNYSFLNYDIAYGASFLYGGNYANNQTIIDAINEGRGIVNYRGHGYPQDKWHKEWSYEDVGFGANHINQLTNNKYPIVFSISCSNGWLQNMYGLGELFTCNDNGASAFYGATRLSFHSPNFTLDYKIFSNIVGASNIYNISNITTSATIDMLASYNYNCTSKWNARIFLWLGDPTLEIWTDTPNDNLSLSVFPEACITNESNNFEANINNLANGDEAIVTLYKEDEILEILNVVGDNNNQATANFNDIVCNNTGDLYVTVSSHNYVPYEKVISVIDWSFTCDNLCPAPLVINNSQSWNNDKYLNRNIVIQNNRILNIYSTLFLQEDVEITVKDGSILFIRGGGKITKGCNDLWEGITVEDGGRIYVYDDIDYFNHLDVNQGGKMYYGSSGNIALNNNSSVLDITGDLHILSNATFTYTGSGYIKFSNPGPDSTHNIFCGSGSSFVLQGSGQNDKIMEVQQSTVHFPAGIDKVELRDGKIEMGSNCRLQNDITTGDEETILNNIKITSDNGNNNGHRGFGFWGQQYVTIEDCTFEYGKYGLNANNTYWGSALTVSGSDFIENQTGLYVYNKGVHLNYCEFTNNDTALDCEAMSFGSDLYRTNMFSNDYGAIYHGSSGADLNVDICEIQDNNNNGIFTSGNFDMELYCTYINNNRYGIYTTAGTDVHIENDAQNHFSDNDKTIYLNYGKIFANHGYNRLQSVNNDYAIYGLTDIRAICGRSPNLYVNNNQWEDDISETPVHGTNYTLGVYGCWFDYTPVTLVDDNPDVHFCPHRTLLGEDATTEETTTTETQESDLPYVSVSENNSMPLDVAIDTLASQSGQLTGGTDYQEMIHSYISIIQSCESYTSAQVQYYQYMAWGDMHNVIDGYFHHVNRNTENADFNESLDDVMSLNETLMDNPDVSRTGYYEYSLDNALLERLRENYNQSLTMLESLKYDIPEMDREIAYIDRWQCYIEAEREAKLGNLSPDAFMATIQDCRQSYENTMEDIHAQDSLNAPGTEQSDNTDTPAPNLTIIPNPNAGNFTVEVYSEVPNSEIKITNAYGQPVRTISLTDDGQQSVQVSGLAQGQYTVYYLENGAVRDSKNMVVE